MLLHVLIAATVAPTAAPELESQVLALFDDECTLCHDADDDFPMEGRALGSYLESTSMVTGKRLIAPGQPQSSYLYEKMLGQAGIDGEVMPPDGALPSERLDLVRRWIESLDPGPGEERAPADPAQPAEPMPTDRPVVDAAPPAPPSTRRRKPFHGTHQIALPTTTTLGRNTLQYRIDHRFGRIGAERGAFGLDVGANISFGLAFGILDGWDVMLRRTNSRKDWELGSKYVFLRQEEGMPLSLGLFASVEYLRDFPSAVANPWAGNGMLLLSRLWFDRWSTGLAVGYSIHTNHDPRVVVELEDGPALVRDRRDTLTVGVASTVWVDRRRRWGIDLEYFLPVPDGGKPRNAFYYRGGDADPDGTKIGSWGIGGSYRLGKHFFQAFFTNNREIHTNLAAPGGQTGNPFPKGERPDFFLGFNLARTFQLGKKRRPS